MERTKAYFLQRLLAFVIDILIITFIASIITMPFTNGNNVEKLTKESNEIVEKYSNKEIDIITYFNRAQDISYDLAQETSVASVIEIILFILYFVVFQVYQDGQTIGKKLLKIKVVSKSEKDLNMNSMIIRALFNDFILSNILVLIVTLFSRDVYFYGSLVIVIIQYLTVFISIIMVSFAREGRSIGDLFANTEVISCK